MPQKKKKHNVNANSEDFHQPKFEGGSSKISACIVSKNVSSYFKGEEIQELKAVLKRPNLNKTPILILAAILEKINLIEELIKEGRDVHELDESNSNALFWAVKAKKLQSIYTLLLNGADPYIRNHFTSDHILTLAMETKIWDENAFLTLWHRVKNLIKVDVNFINKNGHTLLHMAVRREWMDLIDILMREDIEVDITNALGITPLMLACHRNNIKVVNVLLEHKADITREDCKEFIALCYALSSAYTKNIKPPYLVVETLFAKLQKEYKINEKEYIYNKIKQLTQLKSKLMPSFDMSTHVMSFIIHLMNKGTEMLMELNIMKHLKHSLECNMEDIGRLKFTLMIINELLKNKDIDKVKRIAISFITEGCAKICLEIINRYDGDDVNRWVSIICIQFFVIIAKFNECIDWINDNLSDILMFYTKYKDFKLIQDVSVNDLKEYSFKINEENLSCFESTIYNLQNTGLLKSEEGSSSDTLTNSYSRAKKIESTEMGTTTAQYTTNQKSSESNKNSTSNSKTTKRRSKALKAKIAKIKNADLTERLNHPRRKSPEAQKQQQQQIQQIQQQQQQQCTTIQKINKNNNAENAVLRTSTTNIVNVNIPNMTQMIDSGLEMLKQMAETELVDAIKMILTNNSNNNINNEDSANNINNNNNSNYIYCKSSPSNNELLDWKECIKQLPFKCKYFPQFQMLSSASSSASTKIFDIKESELRLNHILKYLYELLQRIIDKYKKQWIMDRELENELYFGGTKDKEEKSEYVAHILQNLEREKIQNLETEFARVANHVKLLSIKNPEEANNVLVNLEAKLLTHKIRGESILPDVIPCHELQIEVNYNDALVNKETFAVSRYMEDVLNNKAGSIDGINIKVIDSREEVQRYNVFVNSDALYLEEMRRLPKYEPPSYESQLQAKKKTMKNMYHLMPSIASLVDSDSDSDLSLENENKADKIYTKSRTFFNKSAKFLEGHCSLDTAKFVNHLKYCEPQSGNSRWSCLLHSLETNKDCQNFLVPFLGGAVRVAPQSKRNTHVISTGGNFTPVELGLDNYNRPLAVKRIPSGSCVCNTIKQLVTPLLSLRNTNILHYCACDFDHNELIIATPLCEYNMGQYVMLMRQNNKLTLTAPDIVRQFLTGLQFLHSQQEPIVHGNLKPSNIFIDNNDIVRVAEFGTHKALFKLKEAPNSSIIWFSTETFKTFKQHSKMECTCASDIQVSGMLIHFIVTAGKHVYGDDTREILKNLDKGSPKFALTDVELQDLLTWMLMFSSNERPSIHQVFSHVYFWNIEKKWHFILTCAGLSTRGSDLNLSEFYYAMDQVASKDNIKGNWTQVIKSKFSNSNHNQAIAEENDDTPSGLLRYIRNCIKAVPSDEFASENDCCVFFIHSFPAFTLSLYRIIENTDWMEHPAFSAFYRVSTQTQQQLF